MNNAHVIGFGKSGIAAAYLLQNHGWQVTLSDRQPEPRLEADQQALRSLGVEVLLGHEFTPDPVAADRVNLLVVSPGVPWDAEPLVQAREAGIEVIGEMELAWRYLEDRPWVGITGTNGKTTTTALTAAIFQAAGYQAPACGNIGYAACELALEEDIPDWVIAEISSYQIEASTTLAPRLGIWTTFTPDHLQRHQTLANYFSIKASLLHRSETAIFNGDDLRLREAIPQDFPEAYWTSVHGRTAIAPLRPITYIEAGWVKFDGLPVVRSDALKMVGAHNAQNLLLAVTAACLAEINEEAIATGIANFPGVPHRLEKVCTWQGIEFINDSKATNYDAAEVGLQSVDSPAILIAGGDPKTGDDTHWINTIHEKAARVLLIGSAAETFAERLKETNYTDYEIVETLENAVVRSGELAHQLHAPVVLLSPACASFDQYPNFEVRGDHFRQLCQQHFG